MSMDAQAKFLGMSLAALCGTVLNEVVLESRRRADNYDVPSLDYDAKDVLKAMRMFLSRELRSPGDTHDCDLPTSRKKR